MTLHKIPSYDRSKAMDAWKNLKIDHKNLEKLVSSAVDYAFSNGIFIKSAEDEFGNISILPFTLFPTPFPSKLYDSVKQLQPHLNYLYHRISLDHEFIESSLSSTFDNDDFMARLYDIYKKVRDEGINQRITFSIIRADYLLNAFDGHHSNVKHVESNTIAASFAVMTSRVSKLHRYVCQKHFGEEINKLGKIMDNDVCGDLAAGFYSAWKFYGNSNAAILFVVDEDNRNILDQRGFEYEIFKLDPKVKVLYGSFKEIFSKGHLDKEGTLYFEDIEIGLVYLRTGYHSKLFDDENDWSTMLMLERSKAIKSPTIQYHLAGCKKIQQILCVPGVLERFIDDSNVVENIRETFMKIHCLDQTEIGDEAVSLGINDPHKFVLKPQREGGGNNIYDEDVKNCLIEMKDSSKRCSYILMERIFPPSITNYLVKKGHCYKKDQIISELGIYGYIIGDKEKVIENKVSGHILRSKTASSNEGGIALGYAFIDTPMLI